MTEHKKEETFSARLTRAIARACEAKALTSSQGFLLLMASQRYACWYTGQRMYAKQATLAKETGLSRSTVARCLKALLQKGWLSRRKQEPGAPVVYDLLIPSQYESSALEQEPDEDGPTQWSSHGDTGGCVTMTYPAPSYGEPCVTMTYPYVTMTQGGYVTMTYPDQKSGAGVCHHDMGVCHSDMGVCHGDIPLTLKEHVKTSKPARAPAPPRGETKKPQPEPDSRPDQILLADLQNIVQAHRSKIEASHAADMRFLNDNALDTIAQQLAFTGLPLEMLQGWLIHKAGNLVLRSVTPRAWYTALTNHVDMLAWRDKQREAQAYHDRKDGAAPGARISANDLLGAVDL